MYTATCVDADVMTTTSGVSMARLEVEGDWRAEVQEDAAGGSPPTRAHPAGGALSPTSNTIHDGSGHEQDDHPAMTAVESSPQSRLTDLLTTGITVFLSTEGDDWMDARGSDDPYQVALRAVDDGPHRGGGDAVDECGSSASDSDGRPTPCKKAKATAGAGETATAPPTIHSCPMESLCPHYPSSGGSGGGRGRSGGAPAPKLDQKESAPLAAAIFEQPPVATPRAEQEAVPTVFSGGAGEEDRRSSSGGCSACSPALGGPRSSSAGAAAEASGFIRRERGRLARRSGCGFLAEADASVFSDIAFSGSGGSSDESDSSGSSGGVGGDGGGGRARNDSIAPSEIELLELVGEGRFSRTHRARWRGETVAVKTLELPAMRPPEILPQGTEAASEAEPGARDYTRKAIMAEFDRELVSDIMDERDVEVSTFRRRRVIGESTPLL